MAKMTVYHGGYIPVENPEIRMGRNTKVVSIYEVRWILAKFKYPTHQINFCTKEALKCLQYRGYEEIV